MTIISNENKTLQFSLSNNVKIEKEANKPATYSPEMPMIICSDADDAINIQKEINMFVRNLLNSVIKEKR